ncbi:hypothetical protein Poli38472_009112 [Pythium oligandrum]|uniref:TOG domain-containing protein n=1 Tax=Pythium oligandrum TaxID=41045 RepID=A0A8K1CKJ6_PYTOL|nr:hypothetical protein Poli38472_009112 [Pythium oligandrum]|eukprot:TMW64945.1 hypothetical protein Poli38472_009112 [Pythium oligandrum]
MNETEDDLVVLEVVCSSSEESHALSTQLNTFPYGVHHFQRLLMAPTLLDDQVTGWESEKFCEYPKNSSSAWIQRGPVGVLPRDTAGAARELKTVPFPSEEDETAKPVRYLRLLVHSCHVHTDNLYNQVGLVAILAFASREKAEFDLEPSLTREFDRLITHLDAGKLASASFATLPTRSPLTMLDDHSPLHKLYRSAPALPTVSSLTALPSVWLPDREEYVTPEQICTRIELIRELAERQQVNKDQLNALRVDALEAQSLCGEATRLQAAEQAALEVDTRVRLRAELQRVAGAFRELDARVTRHQQATKTVTSPKRTKQTPSFPDTERRLATSEPWRSREEYVWQVVGVLKTIPVRTDHDEDEEDEQVARLMDEVLTILSLALRDPHTQVFLAACALLPLVLTRHSRFHHAPAWKSDVRQLLALLLPRLSDVTPVVRNNAAFAIVKIAELTRGRGAFVLQTLLTSCETEGEDVAAQHLYGVLKLVTALLQAFHCCATIDIAPTRVVQLVWRFDALEHANAQVRATAQQLLLVLHAQVGADVILSEFRRKKLTEERLQALAEFFATIEQRQVASVTI